MTNHSAAAAVSCPCYPRCGGCQTLHLPYEEQLRQKQAQIAALMRPYGPVMPILPADVPWHYRHKVQVSFRKGPKGAVLCGNYETGSHRLVPFEQCLLDHERADRILLSIRHLAEQFRIPPFDERTGRGILRHALIRCGYATGEILVVLVTGTSVFPGSKNFVHALRQLHPEITSVVQNINGKFTSMVLGGQEKILFGPGFIEDRLCGFSFRLSPRSFYQVNPAQTEKLYRTAVSFAGLTGDETVVDAYCGTGTIGLIAAPRAGQVWGVELNRSAVQDACGNARRNQIRNIRFLCEDSGRQMERWAAEGRQVDVVFTDPPRSGCSPQFLHALSALSPERIVYISCCPETLARDLKQLCGAYRAEAIQPVDLFPHTLHMEVCVKLVRR